MAETRTERRLAAILAADMVGYSRLMEVDENGTISRQRRHRGELIDPTIGAFRGRIVKTTGDGLLVEFASAVDAVECAVEIQARMAERETEQAGERRIQYRIGINVGDIVIDGDDLLGDGINVAARLEGLATPGSICLSDDVMRQVRGKLEARFEDDGKHNVKNLSQPLHVWRWTEGETSSASPAVRGEGDESNALAKLIDDIRQPTIAVLPFTNMSRNEDLDFFCDGLTESLITDLSRASRLNVTSRNASFAFKGQSVDPRDIGERLSVNYLIEGSVQAMGSRLRVNAQLTDTLSGDSVWADRFDRGAEDLFEVQDELCTTILVETDAAISAGDMAHTLQNYSRNDDALRHVQRGIIFWAQYDRQGFDRAEQETDRALALDPNQVHAALYGVAARAHRLLLGWSSQPERTLADAMAIWESAWACTPENEKFGGLYMLRGLLHLACHEFDEAIDCCETGLDASPINAPGLHIYARCLTAVGRFEEAYRQALLSIELQPNIFPFYLITLGVACLFRGRPGDAVLVLDKARALMPRLSVVAGTLAGALEADGRHNEAARVVADLRQTDPGLSLADVLRPHPTRDPAHRSMIAAYLESAGLRSRPC